MSGARRYLIGIALVVATATGCVTVTSADHGGSHMSMASPTGQTASGSTTAGSVMADAMFAQMMIPHHEQAVEMSELAPTRTTNPAVLDLAARIAGAQEPEIDEMREWLGANGFPTMEAGDMGGHMGHGMDGMLTEAEIQELRDASGARFDELFLRGMIAHHEGAIVMAQGELDAGSDPQMRALAERIISAQKSEIAEMRKLLS